MPRITSKLTVVIEMRDEGPPMVSTEGNPAGDWERRTVRYLGALQDVLQNLDAAVNSDHDERVFLWWVHS